MYYYKGKELGVQHRAARKILDNPQLLRELVGEYLDILDADDLRDMALTHVMMGNGLTPKVLVDCALDRMADEWDDYGHTCPGLVERLGDFEYENEEEMD